MAKIAIDARNIDTTTGRYVHRLLQHLEQLDTVNEYVVLVLEKNKNFYKPKNTRFSTEIADYPWFSFREQMQMLQHLNSLNADLVHFAMPHHPIFYSKPFVTTFHDLTLLKTYNSDKNFLMFKTKQLIGRFAYLAMARRASHLITPTNFVKKDLAAFSKVDANKITVTLEGYDLPLQKSTPLPALINKRFIMYVGQQSDYKNIRRLMQSHQELLEHYPDLMLVLVGSMSGKNGPPLVANKQWAEKGSFKNILFTDFISDEQLAWLYQHTQAYIFPSLMEGFGLPALEAMACGAPIVSSNATCLPEVYGDGAHYFDPYSVHDMVRAIHEVLQDESLRRKLVAKGEAQVKKYSWTRMAEQTLAVYNKVLDS